MAKPEIIKKLTPVLMYCSGLIIGTGFKAADWFPEPKIWDISFGMVVCGMFGMALSVFTSDLVWGD